MKKGWAAKKKAAETCTCKSLGKYQKSADKCIHTSFGSRWWPRTSADNKKATKHATPRTTADMQNLGPRSRGQPRTTVDKPRTRLLYRKLTSEWSVHVPQPCDFTQIGRSHEPLIHVPCEDLRCLPSAVPDWASLPHQVPEGPCCRHPVCAYASVLLWSMPCVDRES